MLSDRCVDPECWHPQVHHASDGTRCWQVVYTNGHKVSFCVCRGWQTSERTISKKM